MTVDTGGRRSLSQQNVPLGSNLRITVAANQGGRRYMEDRVHIETVRDNNGRILYTFLGVFDGHGGAQASHFTKLHLLNNIRKQPEFKSDDDFTFLTAIKKGFLETHHAMRHVADEWPRTTSGYRSTAGTTASVAFIKDGKIYIGHVGDSSIVLGKKHPNPVQDESNQYMMSAIRLTVDHKPESIEELDRITEAGGSVVSKSGVMRVVWERPLRGHTGPVRRNTPTERIPFLAVARSLGDLWSWNEETQEYIVSPDPDLDVHVLTGEDVCLVLASDGLTNVMTPLLSTVIVDMCEEFTEDIEPGHASRRLNRRTHKNHARMILKQALTAWRNLRADNISVISVVFDEPGSKLSHGSAGESVAGVLCSADKIDNVLTKFPESMVRVAPEGTQRLVTEYVPVIYQGALDSNADTLDFSGPGFLSHSDELLREAEEDNIEEEEEDFELDERDPVDLPSDVPTSSALLASNMSILVEPPTSDQNTTSHSLTAVRSVVNGGVLGPLQSGHKKNKYYCNEHGIECKKAKIANQKHESELLVRTSSRSPRCTIEERKEEIEYEEVGCSDEECPPSSTNVASPTSSSTTSAGDCTTTPTSSASISVVTPKIQPTVRVTRSAVRNTKTASSSPAPAVNGRPTRTPKRRLAAQNSETNVKTTPISSNLHSSQSIQLNIRVEKSPTKAGPVTRSRDRNRDRSASRSSTTTVTVSVRPSTPEPEAEATGEMPKQFYTPATRLLMSTERRSSRKRPRDASPSATAHLTSGVTPLMDGVILQSAARKIEYEEDEGEVENNVKKRVSVPLTMSEPTTPVKRSAASGLPASRFSLGRLDGMQARNNIRGGGGEPPAKRSRIWGFLKRLVGVTDSG